MRKFLLLMGVLFGCMGGVATAALPVAPHSVVFLPNEVMVTVQENITPAPTPQGTMEYHIVLPGRVNQKSFYATLDGQRLPFSWVPKNSWEQHKIVSPADEADPIRKKLLEAYTSIDADKQALHSTIKGLEQSKVFWKNRSELQTTQESFPTAEQMTALSGAITEQVASIERNLALKKRELQNLERAWGRAVEELNRYDQANETVAVVVTAPKAGAALIVYSYVMPASVEASYIVSATPDNKQLSLVQSVRLQQSSGIDWKDVHVSVAFINKDYSLQPAPIMPWLLDYEKNMGMPKLMKAKTVSDGGMAAQRMRSEVNFVSGTQEASSFALGDMTVSQQKEMSSFRLWDLGKRTIVHATNTTIDLASETYDAEYFYTLRPENGRRGTLTARLNFAETQELPQGWANCFVDDVYMGSQRLHINGKNALVYLGSDPQVTIDTREVSMQKGEQGVFTKEQTRQWHWLYTINNARSKPVDIVVETAQPVSQDTSISIAMKSKPQPENVVPKDAESDAALKLYVWKKTLEAGESFVIDHAVTIGASVGKELKSQK